MSILSSVTLASASWKCGYAPSIYLTVSSGDTMRKRDPGGVGMASAVKDELPFNSANGGNAFRVSG